jgi:hypothetical protein
MVIQFKACSRASKLTIFIVHRRAGMRHARRRGDWAAAQEQDSTFSIFFIVFLGFLLLF